MVSHDVKCRDCGAPLILRSIAGKRKTIALDAKPLDSSEAGLYAVDTIGSRASKIEAGQLIPKGARHRKHRCNR